MIDFDNATFKNQMDICNNIMEGRYKLENSALTGGENELSDEDFFKRIIFDAWSEFYFLLNNSDRELNKYTTYTRKVMPDKYLTEASLRDDPFVFLMALTRFLYEYEIYTDFVRINQGYVWIEHENLTRLNSLDKKPFRDLDFVFFLNILPVRIIADLLQSDALRDTLSFSENINSLKGSIEESNSFVSKKIDENKSYLNGLNKEVTSLADKLNDIKSSGNFKLLAKGFSTIKEGKNEELKFANRRSWIAMILLTAIPLVSMCLFWNRIADINQGTSQTISSFYFRDLFYFGPALTLELLILYFMRLFYSETKSLKAQLLQIDLRLNLCEFIHDYVATREKSTSVNTNESWKSFESLIFSPLQATDDKIPAVLDGADAIAELASKILSNKGKG
ncbi:hypothetical protein PMPD1_2481 [Paramixta manurensis]|uniref:Uncharacterized protein n=1 Tax=Paramixta manurensis TaxID=2740817 RepID=A0A6M8UQI0_9GAMM|nr:hypothetical protein PMPD1_2481 [Erwiniaceae bacterium PD-1]